MANYPKFLLRQLRDIILQIERMVRVLEGYKDNSLHNLEHFATLKVAWSYKEQLLTLPIDFPDFLDSILIEEEKLPPSVFHEKGILELVLEGCKVISTRMKQTLISTSALSKRVPCCL